MNPKTESLINEEILNVPTWYAILRYVISMLCFVLLIFNLDMFPIYYILGGIVSALMQQQLIYRISQIAMENDDDINLAFGGDINLCRKWIFFFAAIVWPVTAFSPFVHLFQKLFSGK